MEMSLDTESGLRVIKIGEEDGIALIEFVRWRESGISDDREKLLWWAAFLGSLGGICAASIGPEALEAIAQINDKVTAKILAQRMN